MAFISGTAAVCVVSCCCCVPLSAVACEPVFLLSLTVPVWYSRPNSDFGGRCVRAYYLSVAGPLDFRLVIQVLLSPHMILNACVCRLHPCFTSLAEDVALL